MKEVKALLFDLGGVVIEIDFDRVLKRWEPISKLSFTELKATFHFDAAYERHENAARSKPPSISPICAIFCNSTPATTK